MNSDLLQGFYLDDLLIEPLKGQVTGHAGSRHLPPKAAEVLLCLAESPSELVTRELLLDVVWGAGHGSQEALGHAISELRHALGDHPDDPHFIQTLPKRGYRLVVAPLLSTSDTSTIVLGAENGSRFAGLGLFENLKRRGVLETALAYLIVGWLLIQIADIVFSQLHLPGWAATFVTIFVIAGFPLAILLSWFLEYRDGRAVVDDLTPVASRKKRFSRTYLSVMGALAAASILVFIYDRFLGLPEAETVAEESPGSFSTVLDNTIAVLPFVNNDGSNETQMFANGLVDDVITRLSRIPGLLVSSRGDSHTLAPNSTSDQVRQRLRVAMYLEGSVEMAGNEIRVIVQLINSATGFHILSRTFDHPREDFFEIRDEITNLTVSSLRVALPENTQQMPNAAKHNPDLDAYVLYRRGVDELRKPDTAIVIASALSWFDAALEVDPEYAAAHAGKCRAYVSEFHESDDLQSMGDAEAACSRALELNPNLDVVHEALGDLYHRRGQYDDAEIAFLEAIRINVHNVLAMTGLADVYRLQKRPQDAENILTSAIRAQPGNWQAYSSLGYFYYRQGRYLEAAEQFRAVVQIDDHNMRGYSNLGAAYMLAGDFDSAAPVYEKSIEIEPQSTTFGNLGLMNYYLGHYDEAATALESGIALSPNNHALWMNLGDILSATDQSGTASDAFSKAEQLATQAATVNPNDPALQMDLAWINAMLGNQSAAIEFISKSSISLPDDPYADYVRGLILDRYGDKEAALDALELAISKGYSRTMMAAEPHLLGLRSDARFQSIVGNDGN